MPNNQDKQGRSRKDNRRNRPPEDEPWIWLSRELVESDAWQALGINSRRFIDFILLEHMAHAGTENGNLRAPYRQLQDYGISLRHIAPAIRHVIQVGLVDRTDAVEELPEGNMRRTATYAVTWLPRADGTPATNRWKNYVPTIRRESRLLSEGKADGAKLLSEGKADPTARRDSTIYIFTGGHENTKPSDADITLQRWAQKHLENAPRGTKSELARKIGAHPQNLTKWLQTGQGLGAGKLRALRRELAKRERAENAARFDRIWHDGEPIRRRFQTLAIWSALVLQEAEKLETAL